MWTGREREPNGAQTGAERGVNGSWTGRKRESNGNGPFVERAVHGKFFLTSTVCIYCSFQAITFNVVGNIL